MSRWRLIRRTLAFAWRQYAIVVAAAACATAVLVGAVVVGDSTRAAVRRQAEERIGQVHAALLVRDRAFRAQLAHELSEELPGTTIAPVLWLRGPATVVGRGARAPDVQLLGVDERFFVLSPGGERRDAPPPGQAFANAALLQHLGAAPGDELALRVPRPDGLHGCALAPVGRATAVTTVRVAGVVAPEQFGRLDLHASATTPHVVVVALPWLQQQLALDGKANALLAGAVPGQAEGARAADGALRRRWTLADAGLALRSAPDGAREFTSERVLVEPAVEGSVRALAPPAVGVCTWFVNELRCGARTTPYSMVAAVGALNAGAPGLDLLRLAPRSDDAIVLNDWLARDLGARPGHTIALRFFRLGPHLALSEHTHTLRVEAVVPLAGAAGDASLMPALPGLADAGSCRDFEPGVPIDLGVLRAQDEEYWRAHRGTPKAFVTLATGRALWGSRLGELTAIRLASDAAAQVEAQLPRRLDPADLGLVFRDVRTPALASGEPAADLGALFMGLGCFLVVAALLLAALMFATTVGLRRAQTGTLLALGFTAARVRGLLLREAAVLAAVAAGLGIALGLAYAGGVLRLLATLLGGAEELTMRARPVHLLLAALAGAVAAFAATWLAVRGAAAAPIADLLARRTSAGALGPRRSRWPACVAGSIAIAGGAGLTMTVSAHAPHASPALLAAGALVLLGALLLCRGLLTSPATPLVTRRALTLRNAQRHPGRSLATITLLALATFALVAVQAFRSAPPADAAVRRSGTGGFALFAATTAPVERPLDSESGRAAYGLGRDDLAGSAIVPLHVRDGDELSCRNLATAPQPRLLGVDPGALAARDAFALVEALPPRGEAPAHPWLLLAADYGAGVVPGFADASSITWLLHKKLGDDVVCHDDHGREVRVRLVGALAASILQGSVVIASEHFTTRFAASSGHRAFLIDAPAARAPEVAACLGRALADLGGTVTPATDRLRAFQRVQNTYLLAFQSLGALALLLGCAGAGAVVVRDVLARRREFAVLGAIGFTPRRLRRMLLGEHALLLGLGLGGGTLAGLVVGCHGPAAGEGALAAVGGLVAAIALTGCACVAAAARWATRGTPHEALREE